jgi:hypothetical protein
MSLGITTHHSLKGKKMYGAQLLAISAWARPATPTLKTHIVHNTQTVRVVRFVR